MPRKSDIWKHFTRLTDDDGKPIDLAECNICHKVLTRGSVTGTSNMWRHLNKFHKQEDAAVGASRSLAPLTSDPSASGSGASKDSKPIEKEADKPKEYLARMIKDGGYDPEIVEDRNFRSFARCLNPEFKVPRRSEIEEICDRMLDVSGDDVWGYSCYEGTRNFSLSVGKVKTMDREVLYIAVHSIYEDVLFKEQFYNKMVRYAYEVAPRDDYCHGPLSRLPEASLELVAGNIVSDMPQGVGLFMMVCEKTDVPFVDRLKERIKQALGFRMSQEPFCGTYMDQVIHSIARCLLPDLDFTRRMYSAVNNLQLTRQGREDVLKAHWLDDPWEYNELWYSCYCSLEVLRKGCSSAIATPDFEVIGILCDVWGKFYDAINRIVISDLDDRPTSHLCLAELFKLREALQLELESATVYFVVDGLRRAITALDEAIQDSYMVWSIPLAMDPRYKLEYIEVLFETAFGSQAAGDYITKVKGNIKDLYSNYEDGDYFAIDTDNVGSFDRVQQAWNKRRRGQAKTDLDRYLQDTLVSEEESVLDFENDIMNWWRSVGSANYPKVARMALDALAMPTCSKLSSRQLAEVKSIIRGYCRKRSIARQEEEEEEDEEEEEEHDDNSDGNFDAMIQELNC